MISELKITDKWIRKVNTPNDLFLNIFGGRRVAKIRCKTTAKKMVEAYNLLLDMEKGIKFTDIGGAEFEITHVIGKQLTVKILKLPNKEGELTVADPNAKISDDDFIMHQKTFQNHLKRKHIKITEEPEREIPASDPETNKSETVVEKFTEKMNPNMMLEPDLELIHWLKSLDKDTIIHIVNDLITAMHHDGTQNRDKVHLTDPEELKDPATTMYHEGYGTSLITYHNRFRAMARHAFVKKYPDTVSGTKKNK